MAAERASYRTVRDDLLELDPVVDARTWSRANAVRVEPDGRKAITGGGVSRIVVEAHDVNDSEFLIETMRKHELVITDFQLGETGFMASLRFADEVYASDQAGEG